MFSQCEAFLEAEGHHIEILLIQVIYREKVGHELLDTAAGL
jgi:hypothetical protein